MRLEHEERKVTLGNILLILKTPVHGHKDLKPRRVGGAQQDTVLHTSPPGRLHRRHVESRQVEKQVVGN